MSFDPDKANLDAAPYDAPIVFDRLRVPCQCGHTLVGERYEFFPTTVFIFGVCARCGPRRAIFAPPIDWAQQMEQARALNDQEAKALDEFLAFVQTEPDVPAA